MKALDIFRKLLYIAGCAALACVANVDNSDAATMQTGAAGTVIAPITMTKVSDLNFGTFIAGASGGNIVMTTAGGRSSTGTVVLPGQFVTGNTPTAASFTLSGQGNLTFSVTIPTGDVTLTDGTNNMTASGFSSNPSGTGALTSGTATLGVGATLAVGANQAPGVYAGSFDVTVEYN